MTNEHGRLAAPMSTSQVATDIGVKVQTLRKWVREGMLSPATEGDGAQKRITWSPGDVEAARALAAAGGRESVTALVDELAPTGVLAHLVKAQAMREALPPKQVIVVGERGPRVFDDDTPIGLALRKVAPGGRGMFLLLP